MIPSCTSSTTSAGQKVGTDIETEEDDEWYYAEYTYFEGPCTCLHDEEEHGWSACLADDCQCTAGWVE